MLTPIDLQKKSFKSGIGYDKRDVDTFFNEVTSEYERIYKENMELQEKINSLTHMLHNYKTIEKSLQKALVLAQKAADETKETARTSAEAIEADAQAKAKQIIADGREELEAIKSKTKALMAQYQIYKAQYRQIIQTQLELLENDGFQTFEKAKIKKRQQAEAMQRETVQAESEAMQEMEQNSMDDMGDINEEYGQE